MAGPYLDVEWTTGDVLTEAKLDQMQDNADVIREALEVQHLGFCGMSYRARNFTGQTLTLASFRLRLHVSATIKETATLTGHNNSIGDFKDIDISSLVDGNSYGVLVQAHAHNLTGGDPFDEPEAQELFSHFGIIPFSVPEIIEFRFRKQQEIQFLSLFLEAGCQHEVVASPFSADNRVFVYVTNATLFGHRQAQGW